MVDDLQVGRWFGPGFRKQPDPPPQSTLEQQTTQPGDALTQYAYDSSQSARSAAMCVRQDLWRRSETTGGSAQIVGVFDSGPICQRQQCCHGQHQPDRLPQRQHPPQQRNEALPHIKLHPAGLGTVSTIVEPLSEVLAHAVVATHNHNNHWVANDAVGVSSGAPSR